MALTSIIIPTHDRPDLLQRAVESARSAGSDIEIVVVDDGSTDDTSVVCASFPDIVYVRLNNRGGVGHARAAGIQASAGKYISFLDDDDVRLPGSIDRQVAILENASDAALVYGQIYRGSQDLGVKEDRRYPEHCPSGDVFWMLISRNFMPSGSVIVRRSAIDAAGGLNGEAAPADDWDLWIRIAEHHPIAALVEPVTIYREPTLWSKQGSSRLADGLLAAGLLVIQRAATLPRAIANPRAFRHAAQNFKLGICNRLLEESFHAARQRDPYALVSLRRALVTSPRAFMHAMFSLKTWKKLSERVGR